MHLQREGSGTLGPAGERCPSASTLPAVTSQCALRLRRAHTRTQTCAQTTPPPLPSGQASEGTGLPPPCVRQQDLQPGQVPWCPLPQGSRRPAGFLSATLATWTQHLAENAPWETETPRSPPGQLFNDRCPSPRRWKASAACRGASGGLGGSAWNPRVLAAFTVRSGLTSPEPRLLYWQGTARPRPLQTPVRPCVRTGTQGSSPSHKL